MVKARARQGREWQGRAGQKCYNKITEYNNVIHVAKEDNDIMS